MRGVLVGWVVVLGVGMQAAAAGSLWFPQLVNGQAAGQSNRSRIVLMNPSAEAVTVQLRFFTPSGSPWPVPIGGQPAGELPVELPARGTAQVETDGLGPLQSGSAEVSIPGPAAVSGVLVYEILGSLVSLTAIPPVASTRLFVTVTDEENTGVALLNPQSQGAVTIRARLLDQGGQSVAVRDLDPLSARHQRSCFVTEACLFEPFFRDRVEPFQGTLELEVEQGGPMHVTGLVQRRDGALMSLPPSSGFYRASGGKIRSPAGTSAVLRGLNLGGWLVPEGYILHLPGFGSPSSIRAQVQDVAGVDGAEAFWSRYRETYVQEPDLEAIAAWGFNSVRLPFHYLDLWDPQQEMFREEGFLLIRRLADWCQRHGLLLVLDLHCAPGGQNPNNISDSDGVARLWGDAGHQQLTVDLWREVARRFAVDPTVLGYDLLNEPVLPSGVSSAALRSLYQRIASAIREVDSEHLILVEGNWYATDFTGLTPPFDDQLVYSFHKYWDAPTAGSLSRFLELRQQHQVPLWVGEFGENSNAWATAVVGQFEAHEIGWCWWTHKKLESITSPLSAGIPDTYRGLLDYWSGTGPKPSPEASRQALLELAEVLSFSGSRRHPDVLHALLDPSRGTETQPWRRLMLPGSWESVEYDLGTNGFAYFDQRSLRSTFEDDRPWNWGWRFRNDGVDIEASSDPVGGSWNVGWIEDGEWLEYTVEVTAGGRYDLELRVATPQNGGRLQLRWNGVVLTQTPVNVPRTGGWQTWTTLRVPDLLLEAGTQRFRLEFPTGGFNVGRLLWTASPGGP